MKTIYPTENDGPTPTHERKTLAEWAKLKGTPLLWVRAALVAKGWADIYVLMSEQEFNDAMGIVQAVECI